MRLLANDAGLPAASAGALLRSGQLPQQKGGRRMRGRRWMKGDARVVEYLDKGLRSELTSINQYWLHYRLLDNWGYKALAKLYAQHHIGEPDED
jgi:hypothetical protein